MSGGFLHDHVMALSVSPQAPGHMKEIIDMTQNVLPIAHIFHLTNDFMRGADEALPDSVAIFKSLALCKLPYDYVWYEYNTKVIDGTDAKMGLLLYRKVEDGIEWIGMGVFLHGGGKKWHIEVGGLVPASVTLDGNELNYQMRHLSTLPNATLEVFYYAVTRLLVATIMLNSPRILSTGERCDLSRLNKKRARSGKQALLEYHVVDLAKDMKESLLPKGDGSPRRLHWCRGHFKALDDGLHWWRPHLRGRKELGMVEKEYVA